MTDTTYNGWKNYETWCVALWLSNDEALYNESRELAARTMIDEDDQDNRRYRLSEELKPFVEELAELTCPGVIEGTSFVADMFQAALSEVDWYEIAENLLSEPADA